MASAATVGADGKRAATGREPVIVAPEDTLGETAEKMAACGANSALVHDFGQRIGIVTLRDFVRATAARVHPTEARVREWMTDGERPAGRASRQETASRDAGTPFAEPRLCDLQYAAGRIEGCPGEACLYWVDDACMLTPLRTDIVSDPQLACFLLDLRSRVGGAPAPSIFGLLPGLAS